MQKTILQEQYSCSVKKNAPKNPKYSRNETTLKIDHLAKAIAHAKGIAFAKCQFGSKIENAKKMRKTILGEHYSCSVQNTTPKNTKYSRNKTILKISILEKAIAHAKAIAFANAQFGSKIKKAKKMRKTILQEH